MHLHISLGVPTAMQSIQNVWGERGGAGSARNGTVGRKGLEFLLEVIWEFSLQFELSSFLMSQMKYAVELLLA